jgi:dolichyl-phosphate-mannose-protein mannosyltransferase
MRDEIIAAAHSHRLLVILLLLFLALAVTYSVVTPIFEAGDEIWHYPYVQHLATGYSLPIQNPAVKTLWAQEGGQPPLYYTLAALATFWINTSDLSDRLWYNPHAKIGIPLLYGSKNMIVHTSAENFPWHDTTLAVHIVRLLSILFSAVTVVLTYLLALEIGAARSLAAAAASLVAFNPMFVFISGSVNNDSLAAMLATLGLVLLARVHTSGPSMRGYVALGVVLGLAALAKVSDLGLVLVAGGVFTMTHLPRRAILSSRGAERRSNLLVPATWRYLAGPLLTALIVVAIAGWWYLRNYILYGDPFAFNVWVAIAGGRPAPATLATLLNEFQGMRISFWGNFGGVNIIAPDWVYSVLDVFTVLAGIGLLIGMGRRTLPRLIALPVLWLGIIFVALVRWTMLTYASQGRLLFPAISGIAILIVFGLGQLHIPSISFPVRLLDSDFGFWNFVLTCFLFAFSIVAPFALIAPTYALPTRLAADAAVPDQSRIVFEDQAELVGYDLTQRSVKPGADLPLTLFWRPLKPMAEDYSVYIHLFDASGKPVGQWDAFPGNGAYPTRLWRNETIVDSYRVPIAGDARGPSVGRIEVGLYRKETLTNLTARDPQGRPTTPTIARFKIAGELAVEVENPVRFEFENRIALVGSSIPLRARAGSTLPVRLYWRAIASIEEDYTVFVHVIDAQSKLLTQKDDQPQHGTYPTFFWDMGELVADDYMIEIPPDAPSADYSIQIGLYRASDNSRLQVGGTDHVDLAKIQISR